jgi:hypothetical protein
LLSTIGRIIAALAKRPNLALGMRFSRLTTCGIGAMSVTFVCAALAGLLGGWLLLHGMAIAVLGLAMALMSASLGRWEPLPMLGLFDSVALFQVSFLIGAAARVGVGRARKRPRRRAAQDRSFSRRRARAGRRGRPLIAMP